MIENLTEKEMKGRDLEENQKMGHIKAKFN